MKDMDDLKTCNSANHLTITSKLAMLHLFNSLHIIKGIYIVQFCASFKESNNFIAIKKSS